MLTKKSEPRWRAWLLVILLAFALTVTACAGDGVDDADLTVEDEANLIEEEAALSAEEDTSVLAEDGAVAVQDVELDAAFIGAPVFGSDENLLGTAQQYLYDNDGIVRYVIVATDEANYIAVPAPAFDVDFAATLTGEGLFYQGTAAALADEFSYNPEFLNDDLNFVVTDEIGLSDDAETLYEIGAN